MMIPLGPLILLGASCLAMVITKETVTPIQFVFWLAALSIGLSLIYIMMDIGHIWEEVRRIRKGQGL